MPTKINLELTPEQAHTLMEVLEFFSRVHMGQFDTIEFSLHMDTYDESLGRPKYDREVVMSLLTQAKTTIFSDIDRSAYIGITHTCERAKIAWDLYQQLRFDLSKDPMKQPFKVSEQPFPVITITEG